MMIVCVRFTGTYAEMYRSLEATSTACVKASQGPVGDVYTLITMWVCTM